MNKKDRELYEKWVAKVRGIDAGIKRLVIQQYHLLADGERRQIWKKGPYRSFAECIMSEFGISAGRWERLKAAIGRFKEPTVEFLGYEATATLLRVPTGPTEQQVFSAISEMAKKRGGRPPSCEAVRDLVDKFVPPQRPVNREPTLMEQLREKLRMAQETIKKLRAENKALRAEVKELRKKSPLGV